MQNCLLIFIIVITIVMNIIFANGHVYVQNIKQMQLKLHERHCALKKKEIGTQSCTTLGLFFHSVFFITFLYVNLNLVAVV